MARRTKEEAEQTKEAILASAMDLFYEKGFARTTFDEIAKRINLTKGAVYWHFRNKADLLAELMKQKFQEHESKTWSEKPQITTLQELREGFRVAASSIESDPEFCKFLFFIIFQMEWSEIITNRIRQQIHEIMDYPWLSLKEKLTFIQKSGEIRPDVDIDDLTTLLLCAWRGVVDAFIAKRFPMNLSRSVSQAFDLIMDGLKVEKK